MYRDEKGRIWNTYNVHYETSDGTFSFNIMAISYLHAEEIVADIRNSATVVGQAVYVEEV
jgi:hypothetical protein